VQVQTSKGDLV